MKCIKKLSYDQADFVCASVCVISCQTVWRFWFIPLPVLSAGLQLIIEFPANQINTDRLCPVDRQTESDRQAESQTDRQVMVWGTRCFCSFPAETLFTLHAEVSVTDPELSSSSPSCPVPPQFSLGPPPKRADSAVRLFIIKTPPRVNKIQTVCVCRGWGCK